jgi:hypothetical protein
MEREALKLALEALENAIAVRHGKDGTKFVDPLEPNAITAVKAALAQPAQESVFKWRSVFQEMPTENSHILFCFGVHIVEGSFNTDGWASLAYGTAQPDFWAYFPPPPHHKRNQELYAAPPLPPQRTWVGLTDGMIEELFQSAADADEETHIRFARAIEAKLRSINNG